jgi:hypothetical protein
VSPFCRCCCANCSVSFFVVIWWMAAVPPVIVFVRSVCACSSQTERGLPAAGQERRWPSPSLLPRADGMWKSCAPSVTSEVDEVPRPGTHIGAGGRSSGQLAVARRCELRVWQVRSNHAVTPLEKAGEQQALRPDMLCRILRLAYGNTYRRIDCLRAVRRSMQGRGSAAAAALLVLVLHVGQTSSSSQQWKLICAGGCRFGSWDDGQH